MAEPKVLQAGDTWTWTRSEPDYPASAGWILTYYFALAGEDPKTVVAAASGDDFQATVAALNTTWPSGYYRWTARVALAAEVHTVDSGGLKVIPDPMTATDRRSYEEKVVAILEPALLKCAGDTIVEYEFDGVKVKKDVTAARAELQRCYDILRERRRRQRGEAFFTQMPVVF